VPIGIYTRQYLEKKKIWLAVEAKIVPTESVRAALAAVESGDADASFVYKTDAAISKKVKVVFEVPQADAPVISYPMALVEGAKQPEAARKFLEARRSEIHDAAEREAARFSSPQKYIRGLFSGGTFCAEAQLIFRRHAIGNVFSGCSTSSAT